VRSLILAALITIVPAQQRFGKRITVLLDVSGSMHAHRQAALDAALEVVQATATDETQIRVATFGSTAHVSPVWDWPVDLGNARTWLMAHTPRSSTCTILKPALDEALRWGDVVVVTDGLIDDSWICRVPAGRTVGMVLIGRGGEGTAKRLAQTGGVYRVRSK